jgi:hypothetical protein
MVLGRNPLQGTEDRPAQAAVRRRESAALFWTAMIRNHGPAHDYRVFVSDDSRESVDRERCRNMLRQVALTTEVDIVYAGHEEREAYCRRLAEDASLPSATVRLGQLGFTGAYRTAGATRNSVLLQTVGSTVLSADDDVVCSPANVPTTRCGDGIAFEGHEDPADFWCFTDRSDALMFTQPLDIDAVAEHEKLLGTKVMSLVGGALRRGRTRDLDGLCAHLIASLLSGTGTVDLTFSGLRGDCGLYSNLGIVASSNRETRGRAQSDSAGMLASRETVSQVLRTHVAHGDAAGIGACFGFDNRRLLPPFLPGFDNEDRVFFSLVARCCDESYIGHLPFTLYHDPTGPRAYRPDADGSAIFFKAASPFGTCHHPWRLLRNEWLVWASTYRVSAH